MRDLATHMPSGTGLFCFATPGVELSGGASLPLPHQSRSEKSWARLAAPPRDESAQLPKTNPTPNASGRDDATCRNSVTGLKKPRPLKTERTGDPGVRLPYT